MPTLTFKGYSGIMEGDLITTINRRSGVLNVYSTFHLGSIYRPERVIQYDTSTEQSIDTIIAEFKINWDGVEYNSEMPLMVIDGRTYISLREFANKAGLAVDWNGDEQIITIDRI
jgi:hypothetical protein